MSDHDLMRQIRDSMMATSSIPPESLDWTNLPGKKIVKSPNRLSKKETIESIETAIQNTRTALYVTTPGDTNYAKLLNVLGFELGRRYSFTRFESRMRKENFATSDLTESIQVIHEAIGMTPRLDVSRPEMLYNLSVQLAKIYVSTKAPFDLDETIRVAREAVSSATVNPEELANWSIHLASHLSTRYINVGKISDLEEAIKVIQTAIESSVSGPSQIRLRDMQDDLLCEKLDRTGDIADLDETIVLARENTRGASTGSAFWGERLMQLARLLWRRYSRTGSMNSLDEAIQLVQEAVNAIQTDFPLGIERLNVLGNLLLDRHSRNGSTSDLDDAITFNRQAVNSSRIEDIGYVAFLNDLGVALGEKYMRTKSLAALDEAIKVSQSALAIIEKLDHTSVQAYRTRVTSLANHGKYIGWLYTVTNNVHDLVDAIDAHRKSIEPFSKDGDQMGRSGRLANLGALLGTRFRRLGDPKDLEEGIRVVREAMQHTTSAHPDYANLLQLLGEILEDKFSISESVTDFEEAISYYRCALSQHNAPTLVRILAGKEAIDCAAFTSNWEQAFEDSAVVIGLISKLILRSLDQSDKQDILRQVSALACDAAAIALQAGKPPGHALSFLEVGRGVLAASVEESRADMLKLQADFPELAEQFVSLQTQVQRPIQHLETLGADAIGPVVHARATQRLAISSQIDDLISKIRTLPDFSRFLLPPSEIDMQTAAALGPIAIINASTYRCDVIIVESDRIRNIQLPNLKIEDIKAKIDLNDLGSTAVLGWLWDTVARPTLEALDLVAITTNHERPRIWWIPTGLMTRFPLHAAGYHVKGLSTSVLDIVYSSYSTSIAALIQSRRSHSTNGSGKQLSSQALLVAMPQTPGHPQLRFATQEVNVLVPICEAMGFSPVLGSTCRQDIMSNLPNCKIFHFAGHGYTDDYDPSLSSLLLQDWKDNRFTVSDILNLNLRSQQPFLAYLSACGTGEVKDEKYFDESIHLIRAFQLAGFRHVIGTLWEVNDASCVEMARLTYKEISHENMTDEAVCIGLHRATLELRNRWLDEGNSSKWREESASNESFGVSATRKLSRRKANNIEKLDDRHGRQWVVDDSEDENETKEARPLWVPYVHFGT